MVFNREGLRANMSNLFLVMGQTLYAAGACLIVIGKKIPRIQRPGYLALCECLLCSVVVHLLNKRLQSSRVVLQVIGNGLNRVINIVHLLPA